MRYASTPCSGGFPKARPTLDAAQVDTAQDHRQLSGADAHGGLTIARRREGEGAAFEPAQVEREAVPLPGQDLQAVATLVAKNEQVARKRIAFETRLHHGREAVETLAA